MAHPIRPVEFDPEYYRSTIQILACWVMMSSIIIMRVSAGQKGGLLPLPPFREVLVQIAANWRAFRNRSLLQAVNCRPNVRYFDVLDYDGLCERAREHNLPVTEIPHIHYVSPDGDLSTYVIPFRRYSAHMSLSITVPSVASQAGGTASPPRRLLLPGHSG